ncbi:hypothetical protein ACJ72_01732 [Emergomyces africanus]|uniref:Synaptobrevin n=1 Tax=Emergomyces africanus TaxID=1955775 RepID=A0A1B7P4D1_9EURO|nr:hypothetical protein ACJ72_01732 [Emergomyces africanus]
MVRKVFDSYSSPDITSINLAHLLARLENNLLSPSADLKLLHRSPYHRARVGANIEYARTLLLKLELSLPNIKIQSRKHALQADLAQKRQQIKALRNQLDEIASAAETELETQPFSSDNEEDLLPTPINSTPDTTSPPPTRGADQESMRNEKIPNAKNIAKEEKEEENEQKEGETEETAQERQEDERFDKPSQPSPSNTLRSRHNHHPHPSPSSTTPTATTTSTSLPTTNPLLPNQASTSTATTTTTTNATTTATSTQTALSQNETEQDTLTASLLALATQLKTSTQNLHTSLESEKSILARAAEGLDRSTAGMEAAGKRMGALRRMAEGKGWWSRALMYVWIFGLWIVAFLIVFVGPKLRF